MNSQEPLATNEDAERLLRALAGALDKAFISSWQSTAFWSGELEEALEWIKERDAALGEQP